MVLTDGAAVDLAGPALLALGADEGGGVDGGGGGGGEDLESVGMGREVDLGVEHGAAWMHLEGAGRAEEGEALRRFPTYVALHFPSHSTFSFNTFTMQY